MPSFATERRAENNVAVRARDVQVSPARSVRGAPRHGDCEVSAALNDPDRGPRSLWSSLHTHSRFDDGHGEISEYARAAIQARLVAFGASGHAPLPFDCDYAIPLSALDAYRAEVERARRAFGKEIPILLGLELDYLPGLGDFYAREFLARGFDYFVASVHFVGEDGAKPWAYDEGESQFVREVANRHDGDARPVVEDYYRRVIQMVEEVSRWDVPAFVGHLDRIALWNRDDRYFPTDDDWYRQVVDDALAAIARSGLPVELNTSGWAKPAATPNPRLDILRRCARLGIPAILSADAHYPEHVDRDFDRGFQMLLEAGTQEIVVPEASGWRRTRLTSVDPDVPQMPSSSAVQERRCFQ